MSLPPTCERFLERDRFRPDAGKEVVGEDDLLARALLRCFALVFLVEHGRGERCRAATTVSCVSVNPIPRPVSPCSAAERTGFRAKRNSCRNYCPLGGPLSRSATRCSSSTTRGWVVLDVAPAFHARVARRVGRRGGGAPRRRAACCSTTSRPTRGPQLCRSEHFVDVHDRAARAAHERPDARRRRARCSANRRCSTRRRSTTSCPAARGTRRTRTRPRTR